MEIIVGTAGHIDHGKTALVKSLTGVDADRLPEEKRRGITVDLGFAEMSAGDIHFGFVDVPGHERFVKNMLAGASGIDLVMLVIAADEGVMPQTREHFQICRLLGTRSGIIALTKIDIASDEAIAQAKTSLQELVAGSFLEHAPRVCVSSRTGEGIDELKDTLVRLTTDLPERDDSFVTRLPIDRSFAVKGFGAVVTGTLASGRIEEGVEMDLLPGGSRVRIRGVQTHGQTVRAATTGQRVAVNLAGIDHSKVTRGMTLVETGVLRTTQIVDTEIEVLADVDKPLRSRQRVRVHIGTVEVLARVQILNVAGAIEADATDLAQIRLESPIAAVPGERFIIRRYSPQTTLGGGVVLNVFAEKHRRKEFEAVRTSIRELQSCHNDVIRLIQLRIIGAGASGIEFAQLQAKTALRNDVLSGAVSANIAAGNIFDCGGRYLDRNSFNDLALATLRGLADFHVCQPLAHGMLREALRAVVFQHLPTDIFHAVIASLQRDATVTADRDTVRLTAHKTALSPVEATLSDKILAIYTTARLEVPRLDDALSEASIASGISPPNARKLFNLFLESGEIVKVTDEFYFAAGAVNELKILLSDFADRVGDRSIDVPKFKELAGVSRKYAIPLLEFFDRGKITIRVADKRVIL